METEPLLLKNWGTWRVQSDDQCNDYHRDCQNQQAQERTYYVKSTLRYQVQLLLFQYRFCYLNDHIGRALLCQTAARCCCHISHIPTLISVSLPPIGSARSRPGAKGENIFRRRDGRWEARYIKGRELSGKIKYGYCYGKTYREAKEKAAKRKAALANGAPLPTARTQKPFSSYCLEWLHTKKCTVKESTYIKYSAAVNKHIIPKLGVCHPLGFTTELMDDFIKELQFEDELAPKTVHDILVVLHGILKFASSKFAGSFPAVEINYPKIGKKEMRVLSREEQARLVAYLHEDLDSCRFGILLALCTGIRIGELCALQWESVSTNDKLFFTKA